MKGGVGKPSAWRPGGVAADSSPSSGHPAPKDPKDLVLTRLVTMPRAAANTRTSWNTGPDLAWVSTVPTSWPIDLRFCLGTFWKKPNNSKPCVFDRSPCSAKNEHTVTYTIIKLSLKILCRLFLTKRTSTYLYIYICLLYY